MCCQDSKPRFKGVVISTSTVSLALILILAPSGCESISIKKTDGYYDARPIQTQALLKDNLPPCLYLEQSQELDCVCPEYDEEEVINFPSAEYLKSAANSSSIASIKLHSCQRLHLRLDLRPLDRPFHRLRVEDVDQVTIDGIVLVPEDHVSVWLRNVNSSVQIRNALTCLDCHENNNNDTESSLTMHIVDAKNISFSQVFSDGNRTRLKVKVRNADELTIIDSHFQSLSRDAFEIFNVNQMTVHHSEFHHSVDESIVLNKVNNFTAANSLMNQSLVATLDGNNNTDIHWSCTVSPVVEAAKVMTPEEMLKCSLSPGVRKKFSSQRGSSGVAPGGAIALAVVSAMLLLVAVAVLVFLHRTGKLDQYL